MSDDSPAPGAASGDEPAWFTDRHRNLRRRVRDFVASEIAPHAGDWEERRAIGPKGWGALADAGLLDLPHDGPGFLDSAVLLEELGRTGYAGIRASIGVHAYMAPSYIARFGSPALQQELLPALRRGERISALAISEQGAGSDLRDLATRAEPDESGGYRVTGRKVHVANGSQAGVIVTLAGTGAAASGRGLSSASLLVIDADSPGVHRSPERMLGWHAADVCTIDFEDVHVPAERLIGRPGKALMYLFEALEYERLVAGLLAVGGAANCVELLTRHVRTHRVKDAPLAANQAVRHRVADLTAELDLVRQFAYHAAWLHSLGRLDTRTASVLKLRATELAVTAAQTYVQYQGANGYLADSAAARLYRDAMAGTIAAGASELLRDLIFESC